MGKATIKTPAQRTVFLSYCHKNYDEASACMEWLRLMCRNLFATSVWVDYEQIGAGDAWEKAILDAIEGADTFIVLMSLKYANSDFCMREELRRMLLKHERGQARVIGVALEKVVLKDFAVQEGDRVLRLDELQCVPQGDIADRGKPFQPGLKPINQWERPSDAWFEVREAVEKRLAAMPAPAPRVTDSVPSSSAPAATASASAPQPADAARLPYLCDRGEQCFRLADRLDAWQQARSRRPLLVLTEGRYADCVQEWVDRMHRFEIAQELKVLFDEQGISFGESWPFDWPDSAADVGMAERRLRLSLADVLRLPRMAPIEAVHTAQATPGLPTLWWTECDDTSAPESSLNVLRALLSLLAQWPDLELRSMLVVAVTLVRDIAAPADGRAALGPAFESLLGEADATGRIACVALGSLREVKGPDISTWSRHPRVDTWLRKSPAELIASLPSTQNRWPMRTFADLAAGWLRAG